MCGTSLLLLFVPFVSFLQAIEAAKKGNRSGGGGVSNHSRSNNTLAAGVRVSGLANQRKKFQPPRTLNPVSDITQT